MAKAFTPVSLEEYLATSYEPECEYIDGELIPKSTGIDDDPPVPCRIGQAICDQWTARDTLGAMATAAAPLTVEEYLGTSYEPECEYVDGELIPKAMGTREHGHLQLRLGRLLYRFEEAGICQIISEQSLRLRERAILIPDVCVLPADNREDGAVSTPPLLCIEILSPSDRFSYTVKKCEEYLRWGVPACWIFEPEDKKAWFYDSTGLHPAAADGILRTGSVELSLTELWPEQ